jgi:hypothetical protein
METWVVILWSIVVFILGLFFNKYLPSYFTEKGKNLATKEDIAQITDLIEEVKSVYSRDIELLKAELNKTLLVHRVHFETEFKALSEIWKKVASVRFTMARTSLVPKQEATNENFDQFWSSMDELREAIDYNSPFYPKSIYDELGKLIELGNQQKGYIKLHNREDKFREFCIHVEILSGLIRVHIKDLAILP